MAGITLDLAKGAAMNTDQISPAASHHHPLRSADRHCHTAQARARRAHRPHEPDAALVPRDRALGVEGKNS